MLRCLFRLLGQHTLWLVALALCAANARGARDDAGRPVLDLTLRQAIEMALARNYQVRVESFSPLISKARVDSELGRFDPELTVGWERAESKRHGLVDPVSGDALALVTQTDTFTGGLRGMAPWGMDYEAGWTSAAARDSASGFRSTWTTGWRFSLRQPLLQGFGTDVNLAALRIARRDERMSEWALRATVIDVVTQVCVVYNNLHLANEVLRVARKSRELAGRLLRDNQRRLEVGVMSPLDVMEARAQYAQRRENMLLAERAVRDNENFLKQLATDDVAGLLQVRVRIAPPPRAVVPPIDVQAALQEAFAWRPDYRQALLDLEKLRIRVVLRKNETLPRLDLVASLGLLGVDRTFAGSLERALDRRESSWSAGAIFSVPFPNRTARSLHEAARWSEIQALVDLKRLEQDIVVRVDNAAGQIATTRERIASTGEARRLAQESLDAGEEKLKAGTITTYEVLNLQEKLAEAEVAELRAIADYNKAVAEFDRQTGTTLQNHGIVLAPPGGD